MKCYFCGKPITRAKRSRHHVLPRRYFGRGEDCDTDNVEMAHHSCHMRFNRYYDHPEMEAVEFCNHMQNIDWGRHIFSKE